MALRGIAAATNKQLQNCRANLALARDNTRVVIFEMSGWVLSTETSKYELEPAVCFFETIFQSMWGKRLFPWSTWRETGTREFRKAKVQKTTNTGTQGNRQADGWNGASFVRFDEVVGNIRAILFCFKYGVLAAALAVSADAHAAKKALRQVRFSHLPTPSPFRQLILGHP